MLVTHIAHISSDKESKKEIFDFLTARYGEPDVNKFFNWEYSTSHEPIEHIALLESKYDSETGKFLNELLNKTEEPINSE